MSAGKYDRRVTIQRWVETTDEFGGVVEGWEDYTTVWAKVEPLRGREYWAAQQAQSEVTVRVTVRYSTMAAAVDPTYRILHNGQVLAIEHIIHPETNRRELHFMCREEQ